MTTDLQGDGSDQARHQEQQARWMGLACFVVVLALSLWLQ